MGKIRDQRAALEAEANIKNTWEEMLNTAKVKDREAPLVADYAKDRNGDIIRDGKGMATKGLGLRDPKNPVVGLCTFIY